MQFTHTLHLILLTILTTTASSNSPAIHCLHSTTALSLSTLLFTSSKGQFTLLTPLTHPPHTKKGLTIAIDTPPSPFHPWSNSPICTSHLPNIGSKLCIYTNSSFFSHRGISIFTTPKIALKFAKLPPFHDAPSVFQKGSKINRPKEKAPYTNASLPGKGIGMLARLPLHRTNVITAYTPVLLVYIEEELSMVERERFLRSAINQLPPKTRKAFLELGRLYGEDEELVVQDILKANTFEVEIGGVGHLGLFPETSRINHSCAPNAQYYFDPTIFTHFVHATRPIHPGEEITISYTNPLSPTKERQSHLQSSFRFTCQCPRCSAPQESDTLLTHISSLQEVLSDWDTSSKATLHLAKKLVRLYKKAGLTAFMDTAYGHACLAYSAVGDKENAVLYAREAREAVGLSLGSGLVEDWRLWDGFVGAVAGGEGEGGVERHWSWRVRV